MATQNPRNRSSTNLYQIQNKGKQNQDDEITSLDLFKINKILSNERDKPNSKQQKVDPDYYNQQSEKDIVYNQNQQNRDISEPKGENPETSMQKLRSVNSAYFLPDKYQKSERFKKYLDSINEQNKPYFDHLKKNRVCQRCANFRCVCSVRKIQPAYRKQYQTEYQQRISSDQKQLNETDMMGLDYQHFYSESKMDLNSTARTDFNWKNTKNSLQEQTNINRNSLLTGYQSLERITQYSVVHDKKTLPFNVTYNPLDQTKVPHDLKLSLKTESQKILGRIPKQSSIRQINFAQQRDRKLSPPIAVNMPCEKESQYFKTHSGTQQNWYYNSYQLMKHNNCRQKPISTKRTSLKYDSNLYRMRNSHLVDNAPPSEVHYRTTAQTDFTGTQSNEASEDRVIRDPEGKMRTDRQWYMYRQYSETAGKFF